MAMLKLRPAEKNDCKTLWEWANEADARAASFSSEEILWVNHKRWFEQKLKDKNCFIYIAESEAGELVAQVRFELASKEALISVSVDRDQRGKGYGVDAITLGTQKVLEESDVELIKAYIKPSNPASQRAFERAGYCFQGRECIKSQDAMLLTFQRNQDDPSV